MKKPTVILAMPPIFNIYQVIADNLRHHGFEVVELIYEEKKFVYTNIWERLKKVYYRNLLGRREYKKELLFKSVLPEFTAKLNAIEGQADYCLMFWPGVFPSHFLQTLRDKTKLMVHYNWEKLEFLEHEFYKIRYFDKFMFFDPYDIGKRSEYADKLIPTTSFWFDCYPLVEQSNNSLLFIGSHVKQRIEDIRKFYYAAKEMGISVEFYIGSQDPEKAKKELNLSDIHYFSFADALTYKENLQKVQEAGILLDFQKNTQHGLTLRIFESIGYDKKVITNNDTVVHYDFYHPDNIFVWNGNNMEELKQFMLRPYVPLSKDLKEKYSFANWIKFAFDIEPNVKIDLPRLK